MCTGMVPANAAEALQMMETGAEYLADLDTAELPAAALGEGLARMERVDAVVAVARGRHLAAFDAKDGHLADGHRTVGSWLFHRLRVTKAQVARYKALQALARDHKVLAAGLRAKVLTKALALQLAQWTRVFPAEFRSKAEDIPAPRGALLYSRFSREEFGGHSWV